jgi:hypothetical protein
MPFLNQPYGVAFPSGRLECDVFFLRASSVLQGSISRWSSRSIAAMIRPLRGVIIPRGGRTADASRSILQEGSSQT